MMAVKIYQPPALRLKREYFEGKVISDIVEVALCLEGCT